MSNRFDGKVVVVTGGGTGIGEAAAHRFTAEGASVALVGRRHEVLAKAATAAPGPGTSQPFVGDVTDPASISAVIEAVAHTWGRIDVLVNNAAIVISGTVEEISVEDWRRQMATDLDSVFYASRAALPHLRATGGSIINVGSVSAVRADWGQAGYNAAKGGLLNLTNAMAIDHGEHVRVNAVHPGVTLATDEMRAVFAEQSPVLAMFRERIPMRQVAQSSDIAAVIAFLASNDARLVNGAQVPVDGGLLATNGQPSPQLARRMAEEYFAA